MGVEIAFKIRDALAGADSAHGGLGLHLPVDEQSGSELIILHLIRSCRGGRW